MREFQVIVFGATGFTGSLVAEHLAKKFGRSSEKLRWAICGRSESKLQTLKKELAKRAGDWCLEDSAVPLVLADSGNYESLVEMCRRTDVVVSTVGPFQEYGTSLVKACIECQTDYCDSTGETPWIRKMILEFDEAAKANGTRLVPSCGYDSIPSDLGTLRVLDFVKENDGTSTGFGQVTHFIGPSQGGFSGGTAHSLIGILTKEDSKSIYATYSNPYALCPEKGEDTGELKFVQWSPIAKKYMAPFVMAPGNERLVRRSAYLNKWGPQFRFREVMACNWWIQGMFISLAFPLVTAFLLFPPLRWFLTRFVLPAPGEGPDREKVLERGFGHSFVHTRSKNVDYVVKVSITGGDPGYISTGMMLAESAVALAKSRDIDLQKSENLGGFKTPASCHGLGMDLIQGLEERAQIYFTPYKMNSRELANFILPITANAKL